MSKPSEVGFTNDQSNYMREIVRGMVESHLKSMKKSIDAEIDKIVEQLTCEIDELRDENKHLREEITALKEPAHITRTPSGQLVTQDAVKRTITEVVKGSSRAIQQAAVQAASEAALMQITTHVMPQLQATNRLAQQTAALVKYQNDDTGDEVNAYRMAAMVERETDGVNPRRRAIRDGMHVTGGADSSGDIIPGAVRLGFHEDDIV